MTNPWLIAVLGWLAAASVTRAVTADAVFAPIRVVHHAKASARAQVLLARIRAMPPDHPRRWRAVRRYETQVAWADFWNCPWCMGFWVYSVASVAAWAAFGFPFHVWGGPAWFTVPAVALAGRWLYGILVKWLDPQDGPPVRVLQD